VLVIVARAHFLRLVAATLGLTVAVATHARGDGAVLVDDINRVPSASGDSLPTQFVVLGDVTYFFADDGVHGVELWRTTGTPESTRLVADINPGRAPAIFASTLFAFKNRLYFAAYDTVHGCGLWKSDGTAAGTQPLYVFEPGVGCGPDQLGPQELTRIGQRFVFSAEDADHDRELWISDGTAAGTRLLKNINTRTTADFRGDFGSYPSSLTNIGGIVLFSAATGIDPVDSASLWRTDGTPEGTVEVAPVQVYGGAGNAFAALDGVAVFEGRAQGISSGLWRSDGTAAGTYAIAAPGAVIRTRHDVPATAVWRGRAYFLAASAAPKRLSLWRSDGSAAGTEPVVDDLPADRDYGNELVAADTQLFFTLWQGNATTLWRSDGTAAGTRAAGDTDPPLPAGPVDIRDLAPFAGGVAFAGYDATHGCEVWTSDGTAAGTTMLADVDPATTACGFGDGFDAHGPLGLRAAGGQLFFDENDGRTGREPWTSDGTPAHTQLVGDIARADARTGDAFAINDQPLPAQAVAAGGRLVFEATDGAARRLFAAADGAGSTALGPGQPLRITDTAAGVLAVTLQGGGEELWHTDGTPAGTVRLTSAAPGAVATYGNIAVLGSVGSRGVFQRPGASAPELWVTDGTVPGTTLVTELRPPEVGTELPAPQGAMFFFVEQPRTAGLWYTDGTAAGTQYVAGVLPLANGGDFVRVGPWTLFRASANPTARTELWRTDGSRGETRALAPAVGAGSLALMDGRLFFAGLSESGGSALWTSDGTPSGTQQVAAIGPDPYRIGLSGFQPWRGALVFTADDGVHGEELWRSDGTAAGTAMVRDIKPGAAGGFEVGRFNDVLAPSFTTIADALLFLADDGEHGIELWRTDGTADGTRRVTDIDPRVPDVFSHHANLASVRGRLVFYGFDAAGGFEPWTSDGTPGGTHRLADVAPGPASSRGLFVDSSWPFATAGGRLFFVADDGTTGAELWSLPLDAVGPGCAGDCDGGGTVTVEELVRSVGIALGTASRDACAASDLNGDDAVSIDELVAAVRAALEGCGG
jgi:ELWxxDGT repeat protein